MGTKTLIDGVNEVLKRTGVIAGDSGSLTILTDSARQRSIDVAVQAINEGIDELLNTGDVASPLEQAESTITLLQDTRAYSLASDLAILRFPFVDKTNTQFITEYPGGYNQMLIDDPEQDDTGLPLWAAIRPTDGKLYLDRAPTSDDAGKVYTYQYDRDTALTLVTDAMPFSDLVFRAMVPAWVQLWKREIRNEFDEELFNASIGRASRTINQMQPRTSWSPRC